MCLMQDPNLVVQWTFFLFAFSFAINKKYQALLLHVGKTVYTTACKVQETRFFVTITEDDLVTEQMPQSHQVYLYSPLAHTTYHCALQAHSSNDS